LKIDSFKIGRGPRFNLPQFNDSILKFDLRLTRFFVLDLDRVRVLTFDCYGTLIDWESGILACLRPLLENHERILGDDHVLELYAELEGRAESGEYLSYRRVLEGVVRDLGARLGFTPTAADVRSLPESLGSWQPFRDTVPALRALRSRYQLAIISNVDDDLFAATARLLEVPFDVVVTAEQAKSYKPLLNNFHLALGRIGVPRDRVLHVGASLRHDIAPARTLGLPCVWINRRRNQRGYGANGPGIAHPDLELPDLASLAALAVGQTGLGAGR
jgi:2-haloacid dehalogenase